MATPVAAPAHLGRYELLARLAAGGMGEIFLARMEGAAGIAKLFVIKRVLPHLAGDERFRAMLIDEARVSAVMAHGNICQVYELAETEGQLYMVMEYLEGTTVLPLLRKLSKDNGSLDVGFVVGVIQQTCEGLHYAHELKERDGSPLGIVHRDVTPSNLFITESGVVKLLDFGIAKARNATVHTVTGTVKGKYAYMAPEQLRGAALDRRADVFALGIVMYEMLALRRLFQRKTDYLTLNAVMEQPVIDIRHFRPDVPDALAGVLMRALERDAAKRFASARQLAVAVLDATSSIRRPWTQGEIGDFVQGLFAKELQLRSAQISSAVRPGAGRVTMPLIVQDDAVEDDEATFPAVDSAVETATRPATPLHSAAEQPTEVAPPPTAPTDVRPIGDPISAELSLPKPGPIVVVQPQLTPTPTPAPVARRSVAWPLFAIAMVAVAAAALFLLWRQQQQQTSPPIVVTTTQAPPQVPSVAQPSGGSANVDSAGKVTDSTTPPPSTGTPPPRPGPTSPPRSGTTPRPPRPGPTPSTGAGMTSPPSTPTSDQTPAEAYAALMRARLPQATQCAVKHGQFSTPVTISMVLAASGRVKKVILAPDDIDRSEVGACLKGVFGSLKFPRGVEDRRFAIPLNPSS